MNQQEKQERCYRCGCGELLERRYAPEHPGVFSQRFCCCGNTLPLGTAVAGSL